MTNLKRTRSNLVKRLRKPRVFIEWNNGKIPDPLCTEAARCIEALEAENERLRGALQEIIAYSQKHIDDTDAYTMSRHKIRVARAALGEKQ